MESGNAESSGVRKSSTGGACTSTQAKKGSESSRTAQRQKVKQEICEKVLKRLRETSSQFRALATSPEFAEALKAHFSRLPTRYALDVNIDRADDVLLHKRLLDEAKQSTNKKQFFFHVRSVQLFSSSASRDDVASTDGTGRDPIDKSHVSVNSAPGEGLAPRAGPLNPPSFGSSALLDYIEAKSPSEINHNSFDVNSNFNDDGSNHSKDGYSNSHSAEHAIMSPASDARSTVSSSIQHQPMHEVTFSTVDRPKLLSQLSSLLADVGLNIREAHVFSTNDGFSLDVFVVDGWHTEEVTKLSESIESAIAMHLSALESNELPSQPPVYVGSSLSVPTVPPNVHQLSPPPPFPSSTSLPPQVNPNFPSIQPPDSAPSALAPMAAPTLPPPSALAAVSSDDWEIDIRQLKLHHKIAQGSFGDLFRGTYCGQDVAIKILKSERLNESLQAEFAQEVFIMRKVRHKNVVQFIGACTKPPNLSIVTEFMAGGSVYDYLHRQKASMKLTMLLRVALDVTKGMDFLHKNNIIHRDLKAANLLMDENEVVKVADFGVARVKESSGIMTAETGTYRWMAPEVIEHKPYDHKADVFSFGITVWELLTGKLPYADLTPLQAAVSVVQKGLRPPMPKGTHVKLSELMERCWHVNPLERPEFSEIIKILQDMLREVEEEGEMSDGKRKEKKRFFAAFRR